MKRKHILLKNEIDILQRILREEVYPIREYKLALANRLEELKRKWYKVRESNSKSEELK